jgi:hypothetical protein
MRNLWQVPNLFMQKFSAEKFSVSAYLKCNLRSEGEETGMVVMGQDYQYISLKRTEGKLIVRVVRCLEANKGSEEEILFSEEVRSGEIYFGVSVAPGALCKFSYSCDGVIFTEAGDAFTARAGLWIGAKIGFFALRDGFTNDAGYADLDWFRRDETE